ncbi:MAG: putative collagen-binding domain-containing protein, partial [Aggregatilineales bacterium]
VHFMPPNAGDWQYSVTFRQGTNIALSDDPNAGTPVAFDGETGMFTILDTDKVAPDFRARGLLRYVGEHYLQFAGTGEYFLKGGADSPENMLGYVDFDGTVDTGGIEFPFLHAFAPHVADWTAGDPTWGNLTAQPARGQGLIGGVNYLASQGVNSMYFLTYNIDGGDGADTWMWTDPAERFRFDVSKLDQWNIVFDHMTSQGIQLHVVTQEVENDELLGGSGDLNPARQLYYRELVARFAHHPALVWNLGEENDNTTAQRTAFSNYIRALDPYNHPVTVHSYYNVAGTFGGAPADVFYDALLNNAPATIDATSLQGDATNYNRWATVFRQASASVGHPWVIYGDEQGPAVQANMSNVGQLRREALWGNLMGGGAGVEWYFGYQPAANFGDVQTEDWRVAEPLWQTTRFATNFFQTYIPFWLMTPDNTLAQWQNAGAGLPEPRVFALQGDIYALQLRRGDGLTDVQLNLDANNALFDVSWYDPRNGGVLQTGTVAQINGGGLQSIGQPPNNPDEDWIVLVQRNGYAVPLPTLIQYPPSANLPPDASQAINLPTTGGLNLSQAVDLPFAAPGDVINWTITVENTTATPITNIQLESVFADGLEILAVDGTNVVVSPNQITWSIAVLNGGQSAVLRISTRVPLDTPLPFILTGTSTIFNYGLSTTNRILSVTTLPRTGETPLWRMDARFP